MTATVTMLDVATERGGAANLDRRHHPALCGGQSSSVLLTIGVAVAAEHIRHFRPGPTHWSGRSGGRRGPFGVDRGSDTAADPADLSSHKPCWWRSAGIPPSSRGCCDPSATEWFEGLVPDSSKCTAKACRSECGVTGLVRPERACAA